MPCSVFAWWIELSTPETNMPPYLWHGIWAQNDFIIPGNFGSGSLPRLSIAEFACMPYFTTPSCGKLGWWTHVSRRILCAHEYFYFCIIDFLCNVKHNNWYAYLELRSLTPYMHRRTDSMLPDSRVRVPSVLQGDSTRQSASARAENVRPLGVRFCSKSHNIITTTVDRT